MSKTFLEAVETRRSIYALGKESTVPVERVRSLVEFAVKHVPSPFNSQSGRVVVLFGKESNKFWSLTREALRKIVPPEAFPPTDEKIGSFDAGYGTVLFFEDQAVVDGLMEQFALYKDNFPVWSLQSNGMLEYAVWTALEAEGLGASLQHYSALVEDAVKQEWNLPKAWTLLAQMPFGSVAAPAGNKEFLPLADRVKVFG